MAKRPAPEDSSIKISSVSAGLTSGRSVPVAAVKIAPSATTKAPFIPAAEPAKSGFTDKAAALLLGMVKPFPRPTHIVDPKNKRGALGSFQISRMPTKGPKQATSRPVSIIVSGEYRSA